MRPRRTSPFSGAALPALGGPRYYIIFYPSPALAALHKNLTLSGRCIIFKFFCVNEFEFPYDLSAFAGGMTMLVQSSR